MINESQDWARLLYVGDTLFCIVTAEVLNEDETEYVPCVHIEFRWDRNVHHVFKLCEDKQEQRAYFETINEEDLREIMLTQLDAHN